MELGSQLMFVSRKYAAPGVWKQHTHTLFFSSDEHVPPQVLHLMNKMNLPCPFGPVTARPPIVSWYYVLL